MTIKDQDLFKKHDLAAKIVTQAIEAANEAINLFNKRSSRAMLIHCEETLLELLPIIKIVAEDNARYQGKLIRFKQVLDAVQLGYDIQPISPLKC